MTNGGGVTTFFDDVVHNGPEMRTFAGGHDLFITYGAGNGNDIALTIAFPEPNLLGMVWPGGNNFLPECLANRNLYLLREDAVDRLRVEELR